MSHLNELSPAEFAKLFSKSDSAERHAAYDYYCTQVHRAVSEAPICQEYWVEKLWPVIKELNEYLDETKAEEERMEPIYKAADKVTNAFVAIIESRGPIPDLVYKKLCDAMVEWAGPLNFHLEGNDLDEHITEVVGDAVITEMNKRAGR